MVMVPSTQEKFLTQFSMILGDHLNALDCSVKEGTQLEMSLEKTLHWLSDHTELLKSLADISCDREKLSKQSHVCQVVLD